VKFHVVITSYVDIDIADEIVDLHKDPEWVDSFYGLRSPKAVAEHLAWNIALNRRSLSQLDGFADKDDGMVTVTNIDHDYDTVIEE
jgi:hypothetical protein